MPPTYQPPEDMVFTGGGEYAVGAAPAGGGEPCPGACGFTEAPIRGSEVMFAGRTADSEDARTIRVAGEVPSGVPPPGAGPGILTGWVLEPVSTRGGAGATDAGRISRGGVLSPANALGGCAPKDTGAPIPAARAVVADSGESRPGSP
jgi:hypothetical protein